MNKHGKKTSGISAGILSALSAAVLSVLISSCVTIGNPRMYDLQYNTRNMKFDKTADGWTAQDEKYRMTFISIPAEPVTGQSVEFRLDIFDKTKNEAVPLDETGIECTSLMPDTPGYMRILALNKQSPALTPGVCSILPLTFDTPGKWIVIYSISLKGVANFRVDFPITVGVAAQQ